MHTLVIADACFSGSIFRGSFTDANASREIRELYKKQSRKAMTSGTLTTVPDKSKFLQYLVEALQDNEETFLPAYRLFNSFRANVANNGKTEPQYEIIQDVGDKGGQFIFIKRKQ